MATAICIDEKVASLSGSGISRDLNNYEVRARLMRSVLYREFLDKVNEIEKHKWIESEKAGYDIGFEKALVDWIIKYRAGWRKSKIRSQALEAAVLGGQDDRK